MSEITFRKFQHGDEKGLTLLAKAVWGSHFSEEYWRWKYLENPVRDNYSHVALFNDTIIGFVGGIPWRFIVTGKELIGGQITDIMVHPEWRKKKEIFFPMNRKNMDELQARTSIKYGFTNPTSFRIYKKRFHYDGFHPLKMQRVMNIKLLAWKVLKQWRSFNSMKIVHSIPKILASRKEKPLYTDMVIRKIDRFDARFDELWEKVHSKFNIASIRDCRYLNWRYLEHPQLDYTIFAAEEKDALYGFLVVRCERKDGMIRGFIIDLLVDPDRDMTANLLISKSLDFFRRQKAAVITAWMFESNPMYEFFEKNGFSAEFADKVILMVHSFLPDISTDYFTDTSNWYLTMGDCEVF